MYEEQRITISRTISLSPASHGGRGKVSLQGSIKEKNRMAVQLKKHIETSTLIIERLQTLRPGHTPVEMLKHRLRVWIGQTIRNVK